MYILVRQYVTNHDKVNRWVITLEEGLEVLGKTLDDVIQTVEWCGYTDYFFKNTNNYLRIKNI